MPDSPARLPLPGDFAVLLKAGMTVRQAILYNVLSAMTAYLGVVIGILIGHYAENVCMWIFALTAGLFMYVALVDMVSQQQHSPAPLRFTGTTTTTTPPHVSTEHVQTHLVKCLLTSHKSVVKPSSGAELVSCQLANANGAPEL